MMHAIEAYETAVNAHRLGNLAEAERLYRVALTGLPNHPDVLCGLALVCLQSGQLDEAGYRFEAVLAAAPDHPRALMGLGDVRAASGRQSEALELYVRLIECEPGNAAAHYALGQVQKQLGAFPQARAALAQAVALAPDNPSFHFALAEASPFTADDTRLEALENLTRDEARFSARQQSELHFALFKAYDELAQPATAFAHLQKANRIIRVQLPYDEAAVFAFFRRLQQTYTGAAITALAGAGYPGEQPLFVVGMPRSGTSLVEQILASHPDVHGAGELLFVQDLILGGYAGHYPDDPAALGTEGLKRFGGYYVLRLQALAPSARRIVDKLPANFRHLGLLHLALPKARFICLRRDARDTCFSCYANLFQSGLNYTYDLGELGRYHRAADELMAHWLAVLPPHAVLELHYENLIADFAAEARRLLAFCGLSWNEAVLHFHQTKRAVRTKSEFQVRRPLYASSIGRWQPYAAWLGPLFEALGE